MRRTILLLANLKMLGNGENPTAVPDLAKIKDSLQISFDFFRCCANITASHTVERLFSEFSNAADGN